MPSPGIYCEIDLATSLSGGMLHALIHSLVQDQTLAHTHTLSLLCCLALLQVHQFTADEWTAVAADCFQVRNWRQNVPSVANVPGTLSCYMPVVDLNPAAATSAVACDTLS